MDCTSPVELSGVELPCGKCLNCRETRSAEWALRLEHESHYWTDTCFLTLTYDEENLLIDDLDPVELKNFIKRLRKVIKVPIKYYACGEYGELYGRPHYHLIVFGLSHTWQGFVRVYPLSIDPKLKGIARSEHVLRV